MTEAHRRPLARIHIESRECSAQVLERLTGATYFPERLLGPAIVATVCRAGGHLLYVTAPPMADADEQLDYYLTLLTGGLDDADAGARQSARDRVRIVPLDDDSSRWLSEKVLDPANPQAASVRRALRAFVDDQRSAGADVRLSYFEPSEPLEQLARDLGVPGSQASSACIPLATKHAGRRILAAAGIPLPAGTDLCHDLAALAAEVAKLVRAGHRKVVLKLNSTAYGGGLGNALLALDEAVTSAPDDAVDKLVADALPHATLVDTKITWDDFVALMKDSGAIAEELLEGTPMLSPSFQGRLTGTGEAQAVSTHDQVFGASGQSYIGCTFPAHADYRAQIIDYGLRVGQVLLEHGVDRGDYGVDFLALRSGSGWRLLGCEVNLRATGTKHAFAMAAALLGAAPADDGRLLVEGTEYVYEASDGIMDLRYVGLRPAQLIRAVTDSPLAYDPVRRTGVVLHMMSPVVRYGKFGALCIGTDRAHAAALMRRLRELVDALAPGS
ncbi:peptide ligase PGM1-related protein [Streptomyces sp. XD-27]|uniref:peptide ligase PGM1-related protein n=1 Tax=Streptomyces sp. XD-27 TaxID=3062779 RepID=UPI0026F43424|nr:peptide ligase PGM1-related protein [Streptomyces sp. XD-27]WKX69956.1 peptide ligase PGM1-related protein [Streptomyces sp. XD-27]